MKIFQLNDFLFCVFVEQWPFGIAVLAAAGIRFCFVCDAWKFCDEKKIKNCLNNLALHVMNEHIFHL